MEHRLSMRRRLQRPVIVECPRVGGGTVTMRDIGLGGMLVESPSLSLPLHAPLMLAFSLGEATPFNEFVFDAMVVRHTSAGAALMFSELEIDVMRALRAALQESAGSKRRLTRVEQSASTRQHTRRFQQRVNDVTYPT
jgi:hypothetical protein